MNDQITLGIDIGGTNTAFGLVNELGEILYENSLATGDYSNPKDLFIAISDSLKEEKREDNFNSIGIGAPNGNSKTGRIEFAPNLLWKGIVEVEKVAFSIFEKPSFLVNDANAAALGELQYGCAQDLSDFVTITLGTGLGSGIIIDKKLVDGAHGFAGEFGHVVVVPEGRKCGCGRQGCLETYASSTAVKETFKLYFNNPSQDFGSLTLDSSAKDIFIEAIKGNVAAMEIMDYTANILGRSLANFACFSDPQAFVLFGGIAQIGHVFREKVEKAYQKNTLKIYSNVEIRLSSLPASNAAILGAAGAAKSK
jgi:glucokinase